jgi:hypothetical protein
MTCIWVAGLSVLAIALIIPWGIFARYVLGTGSSWPEPTAILLMMVFTFVGAAASYRAGAHMAVAMLTDRLPPNLRQLVACFATADGVHLPVHDDLGHQAVPVHLEPVHGALPTLRVGITYADPDWRVLTLVFVLEKLLLGDQSNRRSCASTWLKKAKGLPEWTH